MNIRWHCLQEAIFFLLVFLIASCSVNQCLKEHEDKGEHPQETCRLKELAYEHPETPVGARSRSHLHLASRYVDCRNPHVDYARALQEMEIYLSLSPAKAQTLDFQNWLSVLREVDHLRKGRLQIAQRNRVLEGRIGRLETSLDKAREENRSLHGKLANLKEENRDLHETIEKLKSLDHQMEEKRSIIK